MASLQSVFPAKNWASHKGVGTPVRHPHNINHINRKARHMNTADYRPLWQRVKDDCDAGYPEEVIA